MLNLTILLIYLGLLIVVTSVLSLRTRDPDPMLGGRNMPWWLIGASLTGTNLSSVAFLVIPVLGYTMDINAIIGDMVSPLAGAIIAILFFVKPLRKTRDASIYTLLNDRFGASIALYASGCYIAYQILRGGLILFLVGQALHYITQADVSGIILVCGFVVIFYTYMTGIEGVMWTDFFQTVLLATAGILALFYIGSHILDTSLDPGLQWANIKNIIHTSIHDDTFITESLGITLVFFLVGELAIFSSDQSYGQRYLVARTDKHAQGGLLLAGLCIPFIVGMFILIGAGLFIFYQLNPQQLQAGIPGDQVFSYFIANQFPNGLLGLAIVGILAAAMSSIDTGINSGSTVFYCNFWEPFARQTSSKVLQNMNVMRNCSFIFGILSIIAALFVYKYSESIVDFWLKSGSLIIEGLLGLFILMRVSKRAGRKSAWVALICGMSFLFWATLSSSIPWMPTAPFHYMWGLPIATTIMVSVGLLCAQIFHEEASALSEPFIHPEEARKSIAKKRKRAKKNMFADSIRPKPFYQFHAGLGTLITLFIWHDGDLFSLEHIPENMLLFSASMLFLIMVGPYLIHNHTSKRYLFINLSILTLALPFCGAMLMFGEPHNAINSGVFVGCLAAMGTMVGWTMLGIGTAIGTCLASMTVVLVYPEAGAPDHWMLVVLGAILTFIYFAMDAAKEKFFEEKYLGRMHVILGKVSKQVSRHLFNLNASGKKLSMMEMADAIHAVEDISQTVKSMQGATDIDPDEGQMELSVKTALHHAVRRLDITSPKERAKRIVLTEDSLDFHVLGSREVFENIIYQVLDNAMYYIKQGLATTITCNINRKNRILTISNDGPPIEPEDVPYIFDIAYTTKKNEGLGVGLTYCKKMLEGMRGAIRLTSKPHHKYCEFKLYFPFSYDGKVLDDETPLPDDAWG